MEKKRLVMIEQSDYIVYLRINESQCDLLRYLDKNGYLENTYVEFDVDINIVEI